MGNTTEPRQPDTPANEQKPAVKLTSDQAATLLRANLANLAKKVKDGKTLSAAELNLLNTALAGETPNAKEYADNQVELADILGVTRKSIQRWLKKEGNPGALPNGQYRVSAWRAFQAQQPRQNAARDEDEPLVQTQQRALQIALQNERLKMKILAEKRELIPKVVAQQIFAKLVINAKTRCFGSVTRFVTLARMAENSTTAADEIRKEMILIWQSLEHGDWLK